MRKVISITLVLLGILTVVTGVALLPAGSTARDGGSSGHIPVSMAFVVVSIVHGWLNRKSIKKYFAGLGWKWAFIAVPVVIIAAAPFIG